MNNKKILIISYFYAPANAIGAVRMTKISKYLNEKGYNVTVVTSTNNCHLFQRETGGFDEILSNDIKNIDVIRIAHGSTYQRIAEYIRKHFTANQGGEVGNSSQKKNPIKKWIFRYGLYGLIWLQDIDFTRQALKNIRIKNYRDGTIISSYGPLASHLLALKLRKSNRWIADFRDPIAQAENYPLERKINRIIEKRIINTSDAVVGVADDYLKTIMKDCEKRNAVITNGFDSHDLSYIPEAKHNYDVLSFCYTGTLYSGLRDMTPFLLALKNLNARGEIDLSRIRLIYAGVQGEYVNELTAQYGLEEIVDNRGFVTRMQSLEIQNDSDVIICLTWNVAENVGYLPGKFFEHLMFQKEILGLVAGPYKGSEMKSMIETLNVGNCFENSNPNQIPELEKYILSLYSHQYHKPKTNLINQFDYSSITDKYISLMDEINIQEGPV